ncbi:structural maintenance of chromosomes protein 1A-like [Andrena cerasifolii]|uniref:structural maintenance of chromosomes protein 1A-like n=1 Tax=Andrena cerasifolii TaxID=2819439 RepID=UPI0040377345
MKVQLERVKILNFKSFKGEVIIGPIRPFTAIIGANGSGKSNIMDAISFVMGDTSRSLRVKQLNELIHGAPTGMPIANRAYVTAVFTYDDGNRITFNRTIHSNSCEYKINDKVVTVQFYISKLRELNLNIKAKNFLVFQGAIESTITKTSKEYTHMFEEISNSIELKEEYERLKSKRLDAENEVQYKKKEIRHLVAKMKHALLEREEVEKYEKLHSQYLSKKSMLQLFELFHIWKDIEDLEVTLRAIDAKITYHEKDKKLAVDLLKLKQKQLQSASKYLEEIELVLSETEHTFQQRKISLVEIEEKVSYWQEKCNSLKLLLVEAYISYGAHIRTIKELKDELIQVEELKVRFEQNMATQLLSRGSSIKLNDTQVQNYFRLKQIAELQSLKYTQLSDTLKREQSINQNKLDNENRKKFELEAKLHQKKILQDEKEKHIRNMQQRTDEASNMLTDATNRKRDMEDVLITQKEEMKIVEEELQNVSEQLGNAKLDQYITSRLSKEAETVKALQSLLSGVYGRLYSLCKPIHSRYEIAMTKVFGRYCNSIVVSTNSVAMECIKYLKEQQIGAETFLPLDSLKAKPVKEKLRDINHPKHVKLLYDVLHFSPATINNAILFVTNNVLVCETSDDARKLAYEVDPNCKYDCVALDGTYYKKGGLMSGGQVSLSQKAKVWQEQGLLELRSKKMTLIEKLREVPAVAQKDVEMNTLDIQIRGLTTRLNYYRLSLTEIASVHLNLCENSVAGLRGEIEMIENELQLNNLESIKQIMEAKDQETQNIEESIAIIEDAVFAEFCRNIGIKNISEYEQRDIRIHNEQATRNLELEEQYNRIYNLLDFEIKRDTKSALSKYKESIKAAKQELDKARQEEASNKIVIEEELEKVNNVGAKYNEAKANVTEQETSVKECRYRISIIAKAILKVQKEHISIVTNIKKKKAEYDAIVTYSKAKNIPIPMLFNNGEDIQASEASTLNTEDQQIINVFLCINFSELSASEKSRVEEDIDRSRSKLTGKVRDLQQEIETVKNPNFKADEKIELTTEELKERRADHREALKNAMAIKREFEKVKQERYGRFSSSLQHITTQLDVIYKSLVNNDLGEAVLVPENPDEPYLGGINFSYIVPGKRFQPLSNLSGGEKTIAALALLFAIHSFRPAPFFVLDEVDAALDNQNIKNVIQFMRSKSTDMQFIIISLNRRLYSHADALVGICKDPCGEHLESLLFTLSLEQDPLTHEQ